MLIEESSILVLRLLNWNRDFAYAAGNDKTLFEMNLETETNIDTAKFQKATAERAAGESGWSEFGEETAAANQDFTGTTANNIDLVSAVFGANGQPFHVLHRLELNAFRPTVRGPSI